KATANKTSRNKRVATIAQYRDIACNPGCDQTIETHNNLQKERNHSYAINTHSLGAVQRNGRLPKPSLHSLWPYASSKNQRTWTGGDHSGRLDAAGGHHRG